MPRYFLETAYRGTNYSGFQIQQNSITIQSEIEKAMAIYFKRSYSLTGASRTDAGVHALQNFFHFDSEVLIIPPQEKGSLAGEGSLKATSGNPEFIYNLNAILPRDIVIKRLFQVGEKAHCRFDALSREYEYYLYHHKDPFLEDRAFYYPYAIDTDILFQAAELILMTKDFTTFAKKNTQVANFKCEIMESRWEMRKDVLVYRIKANRFLRGMVKGLVSTMLKVARHKMTLDQFARVIHEGNSAYADFSAPSRGLFLIAVRY